MSFIRVDWPEPLEPTTTVSECMSCYYITNEMVQEGQAMIVQWSSWRCQALTPRRSVAQSSDGHNLEQGADRLEKPDPFSCFAPG